MTGTEFWRLSRDGDPVGLQLYRRHYSRRVYADGRDPALFVGPGEKTVLLSHDDDALFVWRKFIDASGQDGVNCAVFRNESPHTASDGWTRGRRPLIVLSKGAQMHSCEACPTCGTHCGVQVKCCGCYDGVCCQEVTT